jgi:hypothetical protein
MSHAEQEHIARVQAQLLAMQNQNSGVQTGASGYWDPRGSDFVPKPHDMRAVETRKEATNRYVRENALLSEAATRLLIREMEDVEL